MKTTVTTVHQSVIMATRYRLAKCSEIRIHTENVILINVKNIYIWYVGHLIFDIIPNDGRNLTLDKRS